MKTIRPVELGALLENDRPVDILDIRSCSQFEAVHIEGSHWLESRDISPDTILAARELLPPEPLYLVSENGALARLVAFSLECQGLSNIVVLTGGISGWQRHSLPVVGKATRRAPQILPQILHAY